MAYKRELIAKTKNLLEIAPSICKYCKYENGVLKANVIDFYYAFLQVTDLFEIGKTYTVSWDIIHKRSIYQTAGVVVRGKSKTDPDETTYREYVSGITGNNYTFTINEEDFSSITYVEVRFFRYSTKTTDTESSITNIQVEEGSVATLYVPYGHLTSYKKMLKVSDVCQLLDKRQYYAKVTKQGVTVTDNGNGTLTISGTSTNSTYINFTSAYPQENNGHILLLKGADDFASYSTYFLGLLNQDINDYGFGVIAKTDSTRYRTVGIVFENGVTFNNNILKPQLFDLTEMYGAGNEPKTVEEFRTKFPNELYDYSPRCWVTSYKTGLIAKTKNLFNWPGKLRQDYDAANCTIVETLANGTILQGNDGSTPGNNSYDNGWFRPGAEGGYGTRIDLKANDVVTISADYEILERSYTSPTRIGVYLYGTKQDSSTTISIETNVVYRVKATYTVTEDGRYYPIFTLNSSKVKITNIQVEKGTSATDYVPYGYL